MKGAISSSNIQKKPEDNTKVLENIRKLGTNKECFDCGEKVLKILNEREQLIL